ncbi:hypothetical protein [Roseomonas sp. HF4]|uniref:hypothetical protein n=1 Tax=Roseomonas sp. HF4 TaxID=2562313 RepID=UPI0010C08B46|nr:hypothetical protein [Roseomonas sp. HF4]
MNPLINRARLYLLGAGLLVLLGGMIFAVARWNQATTDRAFVDAAARAARLPEAAAAPPRFWMPVASARPGPAAVAQVEAAERVRTMPRAPEPAAAPARQDQGSSSAKPPPAAAR